jgi:hypothetical protein
VFRKLFINSEFEKKFLSEDKIMFEILKMTSDSCRGSCSGSFSGALPEGIRVRLGVNVIHVIEDDNCTSVPLRRITSNKADRSRLVGYHVHTDVLFKHVIWCGKFVLGDLLEISERSVQYR